VIILKKVAFTYRIPEKGINFLKNKYEVWVNNENRQLTKNELINIFEENDAVVTLLSDKIDSDILRSKKNRVKIISNYAVGYNNIDVKTAKELGIKVTNTPDVLTNATADLAWTLLMSISRRIVESDKFVREGKFKGWEPELFLGSNLVGKKLGVIGFGRIGRAFAKRAKGFDMEVFYYKRKRLDDDTERSLEVLYSDIDYIMRECDFISLHMPLTEDTHHIINKRRLDMMKKNSYIINTARGAIIDEKALFEKLKNNEISGAGLDVYEFEPNLTEGLKKLNNVVLSPHIGSATVETRNEMSLMVAKDIDLLLSDKKPINEVV
jgi:glyoxylate reductase